MTVYYMPAKITTKFYYRNGSYSACNEVESSMSVNNTNPFLNVDITTNTGYNLLKTDPTDQISSDRITGQHFPTMDDE